MKRNAFIGLTSLFLLSSLFACGSPDPSEASLSISSDHISESSSGHISSGDSSPQPAEKDDVEKIYDLYVKNISDSGGIPLSYEEWLATIKGEKGDRGPQGEKGEQGDPGASVLTGEGAPLATKGKDGDSYIDLLSWDFYIKTNGIWAKTGNLSGQPSASSDENPQGLGFYPLDDGAYAVSVGSAIYLNEITVPAFYKGKPVTRFLRGEGRPLAKKLRLPETIASIQAEAFTWWGSLESVTIPSGEIGYRAFNGCRNLSEVILGNGVTLIGDSAFAACTSLRELVVPEGVTSIGSMAFDRTDLAFLSLPNSLTAVGYDFIPLPDETVSLQTIIEKDGLLYIGNSANPYVLLYGARNKNVTSVHVPSGCRIIGQSAFKGCNSLRDVILPDTVTQIGSGSLLLCESLSFIQIPAGVISIPSDALPNYGMTISFGGTKSEWASMVTNRSAVCSDGYYDAVAEQGGESSYSMDSSQDAPSSGLSQGASITYWCPSSDADFFAKKVTEFKAAHPEFKGEITNLGILGEGDVYGELSKDIEVCADVFEIADDRIADCVDDRARFLTSFGRASETQWIRDLYGEAAVEAVTVKGNVYGLPYRNDNGYVLAYDKTIVSDEQAKTLEGILSACEAANAKFNYKITDSWFTFSSVWAAGGKTYTDDQGVFHSEIATDAVAEIVGEFGRKLHASKAWVDDSWDDGFGKTDSTKLGAVIMWNHYDVQKKILGDKLGVATLPSFTVGNKTYFMKSFQGCKALGMRRDATFTDAKKLTAVEFCKFMASDDVAKARLTELGQGVTNKAVIAKTELWTNPWLQAFAAQTAAGNTVSQANGSCGAFWSPASGFGAAVVAGNVTDKASALTALQICQQAQMNQN